MWLRSGGEHSDPELRWRSGGDHFDPEVAVQVRRGKLRSRACSWGPAEEGGGRRTEEAGGQADIKSNNLHLTGGKKSSTLLKISTIVFFFM